MKKPTFETRLLSTITDNDGSPVFLWDLTLTSGDAEYVGFLVVGFGGDGELTDSRYVNTEAEAAEWYLERIEKGAPVCWGQRFQKRPEMMARVERYGVAGSVELPLFFVHGTDVISSQHPVSLDRWRVTWEGEEPQEFSGDINTFTAHLQSLEADRARLRSIELFCRLPDETERWVSYWPKSGV